MLMFAVRSNFARISAILAAVVACTLIRSGAVFAQEAAPSAPADQPVSSVTVPDDGASDRFKTELPVQARGLDIDEKIGAPLPMELSFMNAQGETVYLDKYFKGDKPAVIAMVYYQCPIVCDVLMDKLAETFREMDYTVGTEYRALFFSFDFREKTDVARTTKELYLMGYNRPADVSVREGWEFHTSDASNARHLADALGFRYRFLEKSGQYSHPVVLFIVTPDGRISRYLYGYKQDAKDLRLALMEASEGKLVKTIGDRFMNYCYMYDPTAGRYTLQAMRVMQIGGGLTLVAVTGLIGSLLLVERARRRRRSRQNNDKDSNGSNGTSGDSVGQSQPTVIRVGLPDERGPAAGVTA